jgi:predicted transcriptional regulator
VREEEEDWLIYRIVCSKNTISYSELKECSGFEDENLKRSLNRLENNCLISMNDDNIKILSVNEILLKNQIKNTLNSDKSPVIFENGVIKVNPEYKR